MELRLATDAEKLARDPLTHAEWGQRLTVEQYLDREQRLRAHPWAKAAMRTWLLVEGAQVLASCETFAMRSFFAGEQGFVDGVASVFVEPRLRGKGLALEMMKRVVERVRGDGRFASILYSDVGTPLYERAGYVARPAIERAFSPEAGEPANACDRTFAPIDFDRELANALRPDDGLLIWPSGGQLDWHVERERIYGELLDVDRPRVHGAAAGESRAFWCGDLKNERLVMLTLAASRTDEALALIQAARRVAHGAGLKQVVLWECAWPFELDDKAGGGTRQYRRDSIPMIFPLRPGLDARDWGQTSRGTWI